MKTKYGHKICFFSFQSYPVITSTSQVAPAAVIKQPLPAPVTVIQSTAAAAIVPAAATNGGVPQSKPKIINITSSNPTVQVGLLSNFKVKWTVSNAKFKQKLYLI